MGMGHKAGMTAGSTNKYLPMRLAYFVMFLLRSFIYFANLYLGHRIYVWISNLDCNSSDVFVEDIGPSSLPGDGKHTGGSYESFKFGRDECRCWRLWIEKAHKGQRTLW